MSLFNKFNLVLRMNSDNNQPNLELLSYDEFETFRKNCAEVGDSKSQALQLFREIKSGMYKDAQIDMQNDDPKNQYIKITHTDFAGRYPKLHFRDDNGDRIFIRANPMNIPASKQALFDLAKDLQRQGREAEQAVASNGATPTPTAINPSSGYLTGEELSILQTNRQQKGLAKANQDAAYNNTGITANTNNFAKGPSYPNTTETTTETKQTNATTPSLRKLSSQYAERQKSIKYKKLKRASVGFLIASGAITTSATLGYVFREEIVKGLSNTGTLTPTKQINIKDINDHKPWIEGAEEIMNPDGTLSPEITEIIEGNEQLQKLQEAMEAGDIAQAQAMMKKLTEGAELPTPLQNLIDSGKFPAGPGAIIPPEDIIQPIKPSVTNPEYDFTSIGEKLKPVISNPAIMGSIGGAAGLIALVAIIALIAVKRQEMKNVRTELGKPDGVYHQLYNAILNHELDILKDAIKHNGGQFKSLDEKQNGKNKTRKIISNAETTDEVDAVANPETDSDIFERRSRGSKNIVDRFAKNIEHYNSLSSELEEKLKDKEGKQIDGAVKTRTSQRDSIHKLRKVLAKDIMQDADKIMEYLDSAKIPSSAKDYNIWKSYNGRGGLPLNEHEKHKNIVGHLKSAAGNVSGGISKAAGAVGKGIKNMFKGNPTQENENDMNSTFNSLEDSNYTENSNTTIDTTENKHKTTFGGKIRKFFNFGSAKHAKGTNIERGRGDE